MKKSVQKKLLSTTQALYTHASDSFDRTRMNPWPGWKNILKHIQEFSPGHVSVCDLGCGNGRLYQYLSGHLKEGTYTYIGYDVSEELLVRAKSRYPGTDFQYLDVIKHLDKIHASFDVITAFGITHHIPDMGLRIGWFDAIAAILRPGGLFICTFWQFMTTINHTKKFISPIDLGINPKDLEDGDYLMSWDRSETNARYCHFYSQEELNTIERILKEKGLTIIDTYYHDGKAQTSNLYYIFRKTT